VFSIRRNVLTVQGFEYFKCYIESLNTVAKPKGKQNDVESWALLVSLEYCMVYNITCVVI